MKRLFVRLAFRGHGIGRGLVERLVAEAGAIGYSVMRLDTAPGKMAGANHIYDSVGFHEIPAYYHNPYPGVRFLGCAWTEPVGSCPACHPGI
jgi:putative acetyltransferase